MAGTSTRTSMSVVAALVAASLLFGVRPNGAVAATLCVAPGGAGGCYTTIQAAVTAAAAGDTINVAAGTYTENVLINKPVSLLGAGASQTIFNGVASVAKEGIIVQSVTSGSTVISGFTIQNSALSGVLISDSSNVTVQNNVFQNNDQNLQLPANGAPSCPGAFPFDQDDCGEAIHLRGASNSQVLNNTVQSNAGGILLTDETGATHDNVIDGNTVQNNILDCGITLASHPSAIIPPASSGGQPTFKPGFGIYNNKVTNNKVIANGAAGVGMFASVPGTATYNNLVQGNTILFNGIAGVSIHAHAPNQNVDGNQIIGNTIGLNNLFGDGDAGDFTTTGILIFSAVVPVHGTVITGNTITDNEYGIWLANTIGTVMSGNSIQTAFPLVNATPPRQLGANQFPEANSNLGLTANGTSGFFTVAFNSTNPGQGQVLFGDSCNGLVETATQDQGAGSTFHLIRVTGNDLPGTVGNNGLQPGATYYYELVTVTSSGNEVDNNGGNCYKVTIPTAGSST